MIDDPGARSEASEHPPARPAPGRYVRAAAGLALAYACAHAFYGVSLRYDHFELRQAGVHSVPKVEVVFAAWYVLFGSLATGLLAYSLAHTELPARALVAVRNLLATPGRLAAACALLVVGCALLFRRLVLLDQPITDDELTYDFIAATLNAGHVVNVPPIPAEFLRNQFVVANAHAWYGKYPIGHPLLLAIGKALHVQQLVVPLVGAAGVVLTFQIGRRLVGERWAGIACLLLMLSPHYVWTHATQLSQPTAMVCLLLAALCWLRLLESDRLRLAALAGLALGFGVVTRPLPSALFAVVAALAHLIERRRGEAARPWPRVAVELGSLGAGAAAGAAVVLLVNWVQSGSPWTTGYHVLHGSTDLLDRGRGIVAASVGGALLRESSWLHGWPLSLVFVPLARFRRGAVLVWGAVAASIAYRILVPKTVVATTGPVYMLEVVPLLCLASAAGLARACELLGRTLASAERAREILVGTVLAATMVGLVLFAPAHLRAAFLAGNARATPYVALHAAHVKRAVVFSNVFVLREEAVTWALFPPNPSPALDDDLVFLRALPGKEGYERMQHLARTRFADRRSLLLAPSPAGVSLRDLSTGPEELLPAQISRSDSR